MPGRRCANTLPGGCFERRHSAERDMHSTVEFDAVIAVPWPRHLSLGPELTAFEAALAG
jgi:hypothetical protein